MSRYDGLIIPRSYSEYINKTDAATLQQALQLSGVLAQLVAAGDNRAVSSDAVNKAINNYVVKDGTSFDYTNVDLNTITKSGIYSVVTNNAARDNFPSGINGVLYVYSYIVNNNLFTRQLFFRIGTIDSNDFNIFSRQFRNDGTIGTWLKLITSHDTDYNYGETVSLQYNTYAVFNGIISSSATKVIVDVELPKELPTTNVINVTSINGSLRGVSGYLDGVNSARELTNEYTVTLVKTLGKNATLTFSKSTAFTNTTNNTITSAYIDRMSFTIPNS